jgi:hypothetical protein
MALDPAILMDALGLPPDPWQARVLRSVADRLLLLCCRQSGKSTVTATLALHTILFRPGSLVVVVSPSQRQSGELFRKVMDGYRTLDRPIAAVQETALTLTLANGSRIVTLPSSPETVRGYSGVALLIIDEAAMVEDSLFATVNPMLAVSRGRLIALSTPLGQRGWFYDQWTAPTAAWDRVTVTAADCPRIPPEFLAEQRQLLGERWYRQEYFCSFEETVGQVFSTDAVLAAFSSAEPPLFGKVG